MFRCIQSDIRSSSLYSVSADMPSLAPREKASRLRYMIELVLGYLRKA